MARKLFVAGFSLLAAAAAQAQHVHPVGERSGQPIVDRSRPDLAADIAVLRQDFFAREKSYSAHARVAAEARLRALEARLPDVTPAQFELELAQIVALADNGHTNVAAGPRSRRFNRVPIRLVPFAADFHVLRAPPDYADLLGAQLVAIDDISIDQLRAAARSLVGGTPVWRDRFANYLLESPEQMHAMGLLQSKEGAVYRFRREDGSVIQRRLAAEAPSPEGMRGHASRWLYPELASEEGGRWQTLLPADKAPWSLQEPGKPFRLRHAPELDAMVVEMRQISSSEEGDLPQFAYDVEDAIRSARPRNLVLDLRQNGGGDLNSARAFMKRLPRLVPGRIFALTSPWTFSAAISSLGYLEQAAPDRVTIVGEEVGDRLEFFAEGFPVTLPSSGAAVSFSYERHDYHGGCRGFSDCHGSVVRYPIAVSSLSPDISAPWTIEAYRSGRDPAMDAVARALRN